ncbi:MAG: succinate dehydrogenase/fumarate reductase iron-sulfur subunit [Aphanocapsa sp. GSE-SYN-MK-11-07L]|jgi:succinate dehydrogenase / fumarate reductase iron-sulfur subunit|nr:succinate dehydrogenase/fumarate reductase iron-sulfur subunit [Aphanocapsa sp. GSE-SYN-MK-11-07L]
MKVRFSILRQTANSPPWLQDYRLEIDPGATILDGLNRIKWEQDGTLGYRKNCRNTICGSCSIKINGRSALACKETVGQELARLAAIAASAPTAEIPAIAIAPMGNMPVIKDLVVDMQGFWQNLQAVDPYVSTAARSIPEREFLQSPSDRAKLDQTGNCILCGACYSECNAREVNPEFVGPHALAKAYRTLADSRDQASQTRLEKYNQPDSGVWACTRCFNCNAVCPMDVAPLDQISNIKAAILDQQTVPDSRSVRHRQAMVELVKQGGWIDERKFGLRVVGNNFRDLSGLLSLLPLGWRMLSRGKLPLEFEASTGTAQVRSLITAVQALESAKGSPETSTTTPMPQESESEPISKTAPSGPESFGWTAYAELLNGRFAMIGLVALLLLELFTNQDFFTWLGLR